MNNNKGISLGAYNNDEIIVIKITRTFFDRIKKKFQNAVVNTIKKFKKEIINDFDFAQKTIRSIYVTSYNFAELEKHKIICFLNAEKNDTVFLQTLIAELGTSWSHMLAYVKTFSKGNIAVEVQLEDTLE